MRQTIFATCFLLLIGFSANANAHYLWVTLDKSSGSNGSTNVYFEGGPAPGDGHYLDPFVKAGKTWIRTLEHLEPKLLQMTERKENKKRWLSGDLPAAQPRSIDSYGKFGVYAYGKTNVLLHYYARYLDVDEHEALHQLARAKQMQLDMVPHTDADKLQLQVLWQDKPAEKRLVSIRGPKKFKQNLNTDEQGKVQFAVKAPGTYRFHVYVEEDKAGKDGEDEYDLIRHHATLMLSLPLQK